MTCNLSCREVDNEIVEIERRSLLKKGVFAAIATTLLTGVTGMTGCASAPVHSDIQTPSGELGTWTIRIRPADYPELKANWGIARVDGKSDKPVAVVNTGNGFAAYSMRCTHAGVTVEPQDGGFVCPGHGARFAADGTWSSGKKTTNLKKLATYYDAKSQVLTIEG